jgi:hypothetical protein
MCHGDNKDFVGLVGVEQQKWKPTKSDALDTITSGSPKLRVPTRDVNGALNLIKKLDQDHENWRHSTVRPRSFLPLQEEETDIRSFQAIASPTHYFVTRVSRELPRAVRIVSALSLFHPEQFGILVCCGVQILNENARKICLFSWT